MSNFRRKRLCAFKANETKEIDYKDIDTLREFIMETGHSEEETQENTNGTLSR